MHYIFSRFFGNILKINLHLRHNPLFWSIKILEKKKVKIFLELK
jgi:hypothetical protein